MNLSIKILPLLVFSFFSLLLSGCEGDTSDPSETTKLLVTIENVSGEAAVSTAFAPGLWVLHQGGNPLFIAGEADSGLGLERLAEDGSPSELYESLSDAYRVGQFDANVDGYADAAASPGESFSFEVSAQPGDRLSFAAMFIQSNDFFAGTHDQGFELFRGSDPAIGEVPLTIWDAGTEVDEPLGKGENQPMRQGEPNTGADENGLTVDSELEGRQFLRVTLSLASESE